MKKSIWSLLICILALSLILSSCQSKTPTQQTTVVTGITTTASTTAVTTAQTTTAPATTTAVTTTGLDQPAYGSVITIPSGDVANWNPIHADSETDDEARSFYSEKLIFGDWGKSDEYSFTGTEIPLSYTKGCLVESWDITDPLHYVFHLRKGINFQNKPPVNGRELTSADVKYSYDMLLGTGSGYTSPSPYFSRTNYAAIQTITTPDKYTVVFNLSAPSPLLMNYLGSLSGIFVIPSEWIKAGADDWHNAVGTGPYILSDYVPASSITYRANPDYWGFDELHPQNRLPYSNQVNQLIIPDLSTEIAALRTGKLDYLANIGWETAAELKKTNPQLLYKDNVMGSVGISVRNDKKPYSDVRVRQALQMALNLPEINQSYYGGTADIFPSAFNRNSSAYVPFADYPKETQDIYSYNVDKAKALLADAGYPTGFTANMICTAASAWPYASSDDAELVKSYWAKIGVTLNIKVLDQTTATTYFWTGNYEINSWATSIDWEISAMMQCWQTGIPWNFARVSDSVIDKYIADYLVTPNQADRIAIGKQFNMYVTKQVNYIALPTQTTTWFWQPWLEGYKGQFGLGTYNIGALWARVYVDQAVKKAGQ